MVLCNIIIFIASSLSLHSLSLKLLLYLWFGYRNPLSFWVFAVVYLGSQRQPRSLHLSIFNSEIAWCRKASWRSDTVADERGSHDEQSGCLLWKPCIKISGFTKIFQGYSVWVSYESYLKKFKPRSNLHHNTHNTAILRCYFLFHVVVTISCKNIICIKINKYVSNNYIIIWRSLQILVASDWCELV